MKKTDAANLVVNELKAEAKRYRRGEMQHIRAINNGQHGEFKPLPKPTRNQLREAFKAQRLNWWRDLFNRRVTLAEAAWMLLGFSESMARHSVFMTMGLNEKIAGTNNSKRELPLPLQTRPISSGLVTAFTDMRGDVKDWRATETYRPADLIKWAKEKGCVADEVLAAWDGLKSEAGEVEQVTAPATPEAVEPEPQTAPTTAGSEMEIKPCQRFTAQDEVILKTIRVKGYDPLKLPENPPGKPGVKAEVRQALKNNNLFTGNTVFKRAWERLTGIGDIVIAKVSP